MKPRKNDPAGKRKAALTVLGIFAACVLITFLCLSPLLLAVRESLAWQIGLRVAASAGMLLVAFLPRMKQKTYVKVLLSVGVVLLWLAMLVIPTRINVFLFFLYGTALLVTVVVDWLITKEDARQSVTVVGFLFLLSVAMGLLQISTVAAFPFWLPSLIAGGAVAVVSAVVAVFAPQLYAGGPRAVVVYRILTPVCALILAFFFLLAGLNAVNYAFDSSEPQRMECTILEKRIHTGARQATTYRLELDLGGERIDLNVEESVYYAYEVGDTVVVSYFHGALGEPYYIYEPLPEAPRDDGDAVRTRGRA